MLGINLNLKVIVELVVELECFSVNFRYRIFFTFV